MSDHEEVIASVIVLGATLACIGGGIIATDAIQLSNQQTYKATVNHKEAEEDKYLFFTQLENGKGRVFENEDNVAAGKFNASDFYNDIKVDQTYCFRTAGWRVPFLSWYENIIDYHVVEPGQPCDFEGMGMLEQGLSGISPAVARAWLEKEGLIPNQTSSPKVLFDSLSLSDKIAANARGYVTRDMLGY